MQQSVCIVSEDLSLPLDEGIKRFAHSLIQSWSLERRVLGVSTRSQGEIDATNIMPVKTNKLLLNYRLWSEIRRFRPDILCYVPSASATIFSFLRSRVLKLYWPRATVIMISLQPRNYGVVSRCVVSFFSPDMVFVQHEKAMKALLSLGCLAKLLPSGVDLEKFTPASPERKVELRAKYKLDPKAYTVLHVGHMTTGRNVELMAQVQREHIAQIVLVVSSLAHKDSTELTIQLRRQGVVVFAEYLPHIEELYQLSDCYLFPVFSDQACIGTPLSVLEAMACNLPVITVRYGTLPTWFQEGQGLFFADTPQELVHGIIRVRSLNGCHTREKVIPYSWQDIARKLLSQSSATGERS
jgi:glycosyltransferase involved in cell wall biosynthesis